MVANILIQERILAFSKKQEHSTAAHCFCCLSIVYLGFKANHFYRCLKKKGNGCALMKIMTEIQYSHGYVCLKEVRNVQMKGTRHIVHPLLSEM